jgi:exocyst complex component 3
MESEASDAIEKAARRVAQMLQYPEELEKVEQLKLRIHRKKESMETSLKTSVQSQLEDIETGLDLLRRSVEHIDGMRLSLQSAEKMVLSWKALENHISRVRLLDDTRQQVRTTLTQIERIFTLPNVVSRLESDLGDESVNILQLHHELAGLEFCRDQVLEQLAVQGKGGQTPSSTRTKASVDEYFSPVTVLMKRFEQKLLFEASDPITLVRTEEGDCCPRGCTRLVSVLRILEREEKLDAKANASSAASRPKDLKRRFFKKLADTIEQKYGWVLLCVLPGIALRTTTSDIPLNARFDASLFRKSMSQFLTAFDRFYFADLEAAKNFLPSCFPPEYEIYQFYLHQYHSSLAATLNNFLNVQEIDPYEIMLLLNWIPSYNNEMKMRLGVDPSEFPEQLLGCGENELRESYVRILSKKFKDWISNLIHQDLAIWRDTREDNIKMPLEAMDGILYTTTPVMLFKMVSEQIGAAFEPGGSEDFTSMLLTRSIDVFTQFQREYKDTLRAVQADYLEDPSLLSPAFAQHMIAVVNNCHRSRSMLQEMKTSVAEQLPPDSPDVMILDEHFRDIAEEFHNLAVMAVDVLCGIVFRDLDQPGLFPDLFKDDWFKGETKKIRNLPLKKINATVKDYYSDFGANMQPSYASLFSGQLVRMVIIRYIECMFKKRTQLASEDDRDTYAERVKVC